MMSLLTSARELYNSCIGARFEKGSVKAKLYVSVTLCASPCLKAFDNLEFCTNAH